jgi:serine/threonine protein kinase
MVDLQSALSGYSLGKPIAKGARSLIYEASRKSDGRKFAVKFVEVREKRDLNVLRHLENEYRVLSLLHNDADKEAARVIVRPIEFRKIRKFFKTLGAYLVLEFVEGRSLAEFWHYSLEYKVRIFQQVCKALEYIQARGYVHADLKPDNVLVDRELGVKLIDFGFTLPIGTQLRGIKGTWGYLAPEQAGGRLGMRTDVYNLGAAMYWAFTGQKLPSIIPNGAEQVGFLPDKDLQLTPPARIQPDLPVELSEMILRCCSLDESKRPLVGDVRMFLDDLLLRAELGIPLKPK